VGLEVLAYVGVGIVLVRDAEDIRAQVCVLVLTIDLHRSCHTVTTIKGGHDAT
jgi:hypothetical protein